MAMDLPHSLEKMSSIMRRKVRESDGQGMEIIETRVPPAYSHFS
jgi:hypothetical protein